MPNTFQDVFNPIVLTRVISQRIEASHSLLRRFGVQPGGPNELNYGHGRNGSYNIFNATLQVASGKMPGTAAGRRAPQTASKVPFVYPRLFDSIPLLAEDINNIAKIDDPAQRDKAGTNFIARQTQYLAQLAGNWRTAMLVGTLRDSLYYIADGETWHWTYDSSGAAGQIATSMPAGNKSQLNMVGAGNIISATWANPATDIPSHLLAIHAAFQQLSGSGLQSVMVQSSLWNSIISNDHVRDLAGTSVAPFTMYDLESGTGPDGKPYKTQIGKLNCVPWVDFYITDEGLEVGKPGSATFTKHVPNNSAIFMGSDVSGGDIACYVGGEPIAEVDGGPKVEKFGLNSWSRELSNPTITELFALDNALVVNQVPKNVAIGTVVF